MNNKSYSSINGVLLYIKEPYMSYLDDWIDAFDESPFFDLKIIDISVNRPDFSNYLKSLSYNDFIILHHSILRTLENISIFDRIKNIVIESKAQKISFIGDELNLHNAPLSKKLEVLKQISPVLVCTQLLKEAGDYLYGDIAKEVISLPHALNEKIFKSLIPLENRKIDLGYISVPYPPYLGDNHREKLLNFFLNNYGKYNLNVDIRHTLDGGQKRLNRNEWAFFLSNIRGTFSTEAGSFYLFKNDELVINIYHYIINNNKKIVLKGENVIKKIYRLLPSNIRYYLKSFLFKKSFIKNLIQIDNYAIYYESSFDEIYEKFFKNIEKPQYYRKAISSRHFDAIGTKTIQLLIEGRYNDILKPYENYIPIKEDLSNIDEAISLFKDLEYIRKLTEQTYEIIYDEHRYCHRLKKLYDKILSLR